MKDDIKKVLCKKLSSLPDNKNLLWSEFEIAFENATGDSIQDHMDECLEALLELQDAKYAMVRQVGGHSPTVSKGVNFDSWEQAMSSNQNNNRVQIGSLHAQNVQVGNQNTMQVNVTPEQFVSALNALIQKPPQEAKTIVEKLSGYVTSGVSVAELGAKLFSLLGGGG